MTSFTQRPRVTWVVPGLNSFARVCSFSDMGRFLARTVFLLCQIVGPMVTRSSSRSQLWQYCRRLIPCAPEYPLPSGAPCPTGWSSRRGPEVLAAGVWYGGLSAVSSYGKFFLSASSVACIFAHPNTFHASLLTKAIS